MNRERALLIPLAIFPDRGLNPPRLLFLHQALPQKAPDFPLPMGVLRCVERPTYEDELWQQVRDAKEQMGEGDLETLLAGGETWDVYIVDRNHS